MKKRLYCPSRWLSILFLNLFLLGVLLQSVPAQGAEREKGPVDLSTAIIQVAKQNIPAVVYIEVTESRR